MQTSYRRVDRSRRPATGPMLVLVAAALVPALLLLGVFWWADGRAEGSGEAAPPVGSTPSGTTTPPSAALGTHLLSYRRSAALLSRQLNWAAFEQGVSPLMAAVGDRSCAVISLDGRVVGERNAGTAVIPASNMKILVAAVASEVLGDEFRYTTSVVGPSPVGGVVQGDVFLVGGGDPVLSSDWYPSSDLDRFPPFNATSLDELARRLAGAGVTRIEGAVRGDDTRYDDERQVDSWGGDVFGIEAGPYDALLVNDARVLGDDQRGSDPSESAAREFVRVLSEQGITVAGGGGVGGAGAGSTTLASIESAPLPAVIAEMLTNSDNNTAEMMLKEIGLAASGEGSRAAGAAAVEATLDGWGIDTAGLVIGDGSGLSLDNRVTCTTMIGVLQQAGFDSAVGQGLAIGGETGTLVDAFGDTSVTGRIRGKTGTLNNPPFDQDPPAVKALSGYLPVDGGEAIEYTLMLNGPTISDQREYRPVWAALVTALTAYPAVASPAALGPR